MHINSGKHMQFRSLPFLLLGACLRTWEDILLLGSQLSSAGPRRLELPIHRGGPRRCMFVATRTRRPPGSKGSGFVLGCTRKTLLNHAGSSPPGSLAWRFLVSSGRVHRTKLLVGVHPATPETRCSTLSSTVHGDRHLTHHKATDATDCHTQMAVVVLSLLYVSNKYSEP